MTNTPPHANQPLSPVKQAYLAMQKAQARLDAIERARTEGIAVLGIGCRMPGGVKDSEGFWRLLSTGQDAIAEVPPDRWDVDAYYDPDPEAPGKMVTRCGGFLDGVDQFDADFFGISPREARVLDPQKRLLFEVAQEALDDAALPADRLSGSAGGVFVGISTADYYYLASRQGLNLIDAYLAIGNASSVANGRLSYFYGLQGPSISVDTACSSSLVAVHLACQSLRSGECDFAIVGGVNVMVSPELAISFSKAHMLAADGRCKAFAASADGYGRGEGVGVLVLKRLSDAQAAGDRIRAVIRGSAVNQDGPSSGLTVPSGLAQQEVIRRALASARLSPDEIDYLEAHGTGTPLGDPIEMGAIGAVFGKRREPLWVGSVKTNLGHLEAAAGIAGLIKAILAVEQGDVPPHLHFSVPSPHIPWERLPVKIPAACRPWPSVNRPRRAGVNSFGFTGTNVHVVVEEAPRAEEESRGREPADAGQQRPCHLVTVSAKSREALVDCARSYAERLKQCPNLRLADVSLTSAVGRSHFSHRAAVLARTVDEALNGLDALAQQVGTPSGVFFGESRETGKVAFLFSSQSAQYAGNGAGLYEHEPAFRRVIDRCDAIFRDELPLRLTDVLFSRAHASAENPLDQTRYAELSLFAVEYALAEVWQSWGIRPSWLLGHGIGEYVAACVAGVFSLEDALRLVVARARLMQERPGDDSMLARFAEVAAKVSYHVPRRSVVSSVTGRIEGARMASPEYWREHLRQTIRFDAGVETLLAEGARTLLEIGPQCNVRERDARWLGSLDPQRPDEDVMLSSLAQLYVAGEEVDWPGFFQGFAGRRISLPSYSFQHRHFWVQTPNASGNHFDNCRVENGRPRPHPPLHPLLGHRWESAAATDWLQFDASLAPETPSYLGGHRLWGVTVLPATAYLEMALAAVHELQGGGAVEFQEIAWERALFLEEDQPRRVQFIMRPEGDNYQWEVFSSEDQAPTNGRPQWIRHAVGKFLPGAEPARLAPVDLGALRSRLLDELPVEAYYTRLRSTGLEYGESFRGLVRLWRGAGEALGEVQLPDELSGAAAEHQYHPAMLDACLQVLAAVVGEDHQTAAVPVGVERVEAWGRPGATVLSHGRLRDTGDHGEPGQQVADVELLDPQGVLLARLTGVRLQVVRSELVLGLRQERESGPELDAGAAAPPSVDLAELKSLAPAQQRDRVAAFLAEQAAAVLRLGPADNVNSEKSLVEMGMDSMMGVEFLYRINRGLKINLPGQTLLAEPYLSPLAEEIVALLGEETAPAAAASDATSDGAPAVPAQPVSDNAWLPYLGSRPGARARLFCFHGADNTAAAFADWAGRLPAEIEVCPVELPGCGARAAEATIDDPHALLETLCDVLLDHLDRPFALFGHADGAALALHLACHVQERFGLAPARLFLAANAPPPGDVPCKLDCTATVFWPQSDSTLSQDDLLQWRQHIAGNFRVEPLPAGEADYLSNSDDLLRIIASDLHDALTQ